MKKILCLTLVLGTINAHATQCPPLTTEEVKQMGNSFIDHNNTQWRITDTDRTKMSHATKVEFSRPFPTEHGSICVYRVYYDEPGGNKEFFNLTIEHP